MNIEKSIDFSFKKSDALLIVDPQLDFMPGGALAVTDGDRIISVVNTLIDLAQAHKIPIIISRDWHPKNHCSFKPQGGPWPVHCVQFSQGAEFHPDINVPCEALIISKGFDPAKEAYSAFEGQSQEGEKLVDYLNQRKIKRVVVVGLALDYCVYHTATDALKNGFEVFIVKEATRAIDDSAALNKIRELEFSYTQNVSV